MQAEQMDIFGLGTWFGKTCLEHSQAEVPKEVTSKPSLKKRSKSSGKKSPIFLSLTTDGLPPDVSAAWETAERPFPSLGDYTTHSFGESPKDGVESRLSQILEACPLPKYSLSSRACEGILRRAERRGKDLPSELREALEYQVLHSQN